MKKARMRWEGQTAFWGCLTFVLLLVTKNRWEIKFAWFQNLFLGKPASGVEATWRQSTSLPPQPHSKAPTLPSCGCAEEKWWEFGDSHHSGCSHFHSRLSERPQPHLQKLHSIHQPKAATCWGRTKPQGGLSSQKWTAENLEEGRSWNPIWHGSSGPAGWNRTLSLCPPRQEQYTTDWDNPPPPPRAIYTSQRKTRPIFNEKIPKANSHQHNQNLHRPHPGSLLWASKVACVQRKGKYRGFIHSNTVQSSQPGVHPTQE